MTLTISAVLEELNHQSNQLAGRHAEKWAFKKESEGKFQETIWAFEQAESSLTLKIIKDVFVEISWKHDQEAMLRELLSKTFTHLSYQGFLVFPPTGDDELFFPVTKTGERFLQWLEPVTRYISISNQFKQPMINLPFAKTKIELLFDFDGSSVLLREENQKVSVIASREDMDHFLAPHMKAKTAIQTFSQVAFDIALRYDKAAFCTNKFLMHCFSEEMNFRFSYWKTPSGMTYHMVCYWQYEKAFDERFTSPERVEASLTKRLEELFAKNRLKALFAGKTDNYFLRVFSQELGSSFSSQDHFPDYFQGSLSANEAKKYINHTHAQHQAIPLQNTYSLAVIQNVFNKQKTAVGTPLFAEEIIAAFQYGEYVFLCGDFMMPKPVIYSLPESTFHEMMTTHPTNQ